MAPAARRSSTRKAVKRELYIAPTAATHPRKPAVKKAKKTAVKPKITKTTKSKAKPTTKVAKGKKVVTKKVSKAAVKEPKAPKGKHHPNDKLTPRANLTEYKQNPTFESKEEIPFVSIEAYSKLAIRAVLTNNEGLLNRLRDDVKHVSSLHYPQSSNLENFNALRYALEKENWPMIKLLCEDFKKPKQNRVQPLGSLLETMGTGQANFYMLGHATRNIQMTRGGKEGNNALTKHTYSVPDVEACVLEMIQKDINIGLIQKLIAMKYLSDGELRSQVYTAVRNGNRKLAGKLIQLYVSYGFNDLHQQVLLNDNQNLKEFRTVSVKKKGQDNKSVTPMHCACINPNPKYAQELMAVEPDYNHPDDEGWRSTHYAAVCAGCKPLELLLSKGASAYDVDKQGNMPLHQAARVGRLQNVEVLIKKLKENDPELAAINQKNRQSYAPIHLAAMNGHMDVIKALTKAGANIELQCGAGKGKMNALMFACQQGYFDIVKYLFEQYNCVVNKQDKLKRTPLIHAILNGHAHIVSYLLRIGVDPDLPDSSGNTPTHYAAAYGWYFCLKLLVEAEADINKGNDWQLSPLAVAYMKGHMGLADYLLNHSNTDINIQDDKGMTLVSLTISAGISDSTQEQLNYLLKDKKADSTIPDSLGNTPLHLLAMSIVRISYQNKKLVTEKDKRKETVRLQKDATELLMKFGCDITKLNETGKTAMALAIQAGNIELAELCAKNGCLIGTGEVPLNGTDNILHFLVRRKQINRNQPQFSWGNQNQMYGTEFLADAESLFSLIAKNEPNLVKELLCYTDPDGYTPFLLACKIYSEIQDNDNETFKLALSGLRNLIKSMLKLQFSCYFHRVHTEKKDDISDKNQNDDDDEDDDEGNYSDEDEDDEEREQRKQNKTSGEGLSCFHLALNSNKGEQEAEINGQLTKKPLLSLLLAGIPHHSAALDMKNSDGHSPLMAAIHLKDTNAALMLIAAGANANFKVTKGSSEFTKEPQNQQQSTFAQGRMFQQAPIQLATAKATGLFGGIRQQLSQQDKIEEKDKPEKPTNVSVLMAAVQHEMFDVVKALIVAGAEVNAQDSEGNTPLHYATDHPSSLMADVMKTMLDKGALLAPLNNKRRTPLHVACNGDTGSADISTEPIELILKSSSNINATGLFTQDIRGRIPLHYIFVKIGKHKENTAIDPIAVCSVLLQAMKSQPSYFNLADMFKQTPLHCAAKRGSNICCMTLLRNSAVKVDVKDEVGNTPLGITIQNRHKDCALTLLQAHASIEPTITQMSGPYESMEDYTKKNQWKWTPQKEEPPKISKISIPSAVVRNEWQGVIYVIMDLMTKDFESIYWLATAAIEHQKYNLALTIIRILKGLANQAGLANADSQKNLFYVLADTASPTKDPDLQIKVAEALLTLGLSWVKEEKTSSLNSKFTSPVLIQAIKNRNMKLIEFFKSQGDWTKVIQNLSNNFYNPFTALFVGNLNELNSDTWKNFMKDLCKIYQADKRQTIHPILNQVAPFPAVADQTDPEGRKDPSGEHWVKLTPLIHAIQSQNYELVKFLHKQIGVDVRVVDGEKGMTPIMHAVRTNNIHIVKILLNCDYEIPDSEKQIAEEEDDDVDEEEEDFSAARVFGKTPQLGKSQFSDAAANGDDDEPMDEDEVEEEERTPVKASRKRKKTPKKGKAKRKRPAATEFTMKGHFLVDLNAQDNDGLTVIHHCVKPFHWGSWSNIELLSLLLKLGALADIKDRLHSLRPLDLAIETGQQALADVLKEATKLKTSVHANFYDDFNHKVAKHVYDVDADAAAFLKEDADKRKKDQDKMAKEVERKRLRPHKNSSYQDIGEIVVCKESNHDYNVLLNKVDLQYGSYGYYNFYRLQLIKRKGSELYIVFTHWGRIGDEGQYQRTPFGKLEDAEKEFHSIFRSKSGNDWLNINNFTDIPKKYRLIAKDSGTTEESAMCDLKINLDFNTSSKKLQKHLQKLVADISNTEALQNKTKRVLRNGQFLMPFGRLQRDALLKAREILKEIAQYADDLLNARKEDSGGKYGQTRHGQVFTDKCLRIMQGMFDLSNDFYQLVPFGGFQERQLPVIDENSWKEYLTTIENLLEFEVAGKILCAAAYKKKEINPIEYIYGALETELELLNPIEYEAQAIIHYINNTDSNCQIVGIYKVFQENTNLDQCPKENRKFLWHGTSAVNLLSIFKVGLLAAPPMALHTGYLFGKGIYTADTFSKSAGYCGQSSTGHKYAFLCEVALGKQKELTNIWNIDDTESMPKGFNSIKAMGQSAPDRKFDVTLHSGALLPMGKLVQQTPQKNQYFGLNYNEYIVYKPEQVAIRYLVVFK